MKEMTVARSTFTEWFRSYRVTKLAAFILIAVPTVYLVAGWYSDTLDIRFYTQEWGPLEVSHALLCAVSSWLFYLAWRDGRGPVKVAGGALAMLAAAAFVRELDIKKTAASLGLDGVHFLADNGLQEVLLVGMTTPIFVYLFRQREHFWGCVALGLRWPAWPLFLAGAIILGTVYLDERVVVNVRMRFWEELVETFGYLLMALAGWRHLQLVGDERWERVA
jgi:hypothetical protein